MHDNFHGSEAPFRPGPAVSSTACGSVGGCSRGSLERILIGCLILVSALVLVSSPVHARSSSGAADSPLTEEQQKSLARAVRYVKHGKGSKAAPIFSDVVASSSDLPKCLAVCEYTEQFGYPLVDVRRALMKKAVGLCRTKDDYILVALKSRQYECYDVTRKSIQQLISMAQTPEELTDLARKAKEVSLNDVSHLAMEKAYVQCRTVPQALEYARQVHLMGMDDLLRKVLKDLIDDEPKTRQLCILLRKIENFGMKDMNRYCLKKALTQAMTVQDFADVWEAARRHRQKDIFDVAAYRGKKMKLIQQIKSDRAAHSRKVQAWQEERSKQLDSSQHRVNSDLAKQGAQSGF